MIKIELNEFEMKLCHFIGKKRNSENINNHVQNARMSNLDDEEINIQGFIAEFAFCKKFNLFPDFDISSRNGSFDGKTKNGKRYDIKSTTNKKGNLLATLKHNKDVDIYVLSYLDKNVVEIVGWIDKDEFINEKNIKNLGHGDGYFLHKNKLNKF